MTIPTSKYLKNKARLRLESGKDPQRVVMVYAAITLASSLLVTAVRYALANQISQTGGLSGIGLRSVLSTADNVLPILQTLLVMCLDLGYIAAMLRISRRQYASPMSLKAGTERFWVLLRSRVLLGFIYFGIGLGSFYLSIFVFMMTPLSRSFTELTAPLISGGTFDPIMLLEDELLMNAVMRSMIPYFFVYAAVLALLALPVIYQYRLVDYLLVDRPQEGALAAMRRSKIMMRQNRFSLFKIDLSFWWYFLLQLLAATIAYSDVILAAVGVELPFSDTAGFFVSFIVYIAVEFTLLWFFRNQVEVTYALAYDSLVPKEEPQGMVLGNIFQM